MKPLITATVLLLAASLPAQIAYKPPSTTISPTYCSDRLAIQFFSATPAPAQPGQEVSVSMTIKNRCSTAADVPWRIAKNNIILGEGMISGLAGGATNTVVAKWPAVAGNHHFYGDADPHNSLNDSARGNNIAAQDMTVQPRRVTEMLDYVKARDAGARFNYGLDSGVQCDTMPVTPPAYYGDNFPASSVQFKMNCGTSVIGGRATPEAFANFTLKNGWKVKSVEHVHTAHLFTGSAYQCESNGRCSAQWEARPSDGSVTNNPHSRMRVWANAGQVLFYYVRIMVEGPEGTSPYVCQTGIDCNSGLPQ